MNYDWNFFFNEDTGVFSFNVGIRGKIQSINYLLDVRETEICCLWYVFSWCGS